MGRFVGSTTFKPVGTVNDAFSRAEVYTTPGSSSWTVPAGVTTAKVFVIGAGSCYRTTQFCFCSVGCCSGVTTPICNYCMNFVGHLPGAGGGYSEKTLTGLVPGSVMSISVGSVGGLTASSASIGTTTVTATNATETTINFACTNNSTARDTALDNPVSLGFSIPRCGYISCINGYFNSGGTATGGDVNRSGGRGTFVPYFVENSCMDYSTSTTSWSGGGNCLKGCTCWQCNNSGYDYSFGGTRYNCNCFIAKYCAMNNCGNACCGAQLCVNADCICLITYHNVFGGQCYYLMPWASCVCQRAWSDVTLGTSNPFPLGNVSYSAGSAQPKYVFAGAGTRNTEGAVGYDPNESLPDINSSNNVYTVPAGIGASSGRSAAAGLDGASETIINNQSGYCAALPLTGVTTGTCWGSGSLACCICFGQDHFNFYFGSGISQYPWAGFCNLGEQLAQVSGQSVASVSAGKYKCMNIGFARDSNLTTPQNQATIPLSGLKNGTTGLNQSDVMFGYGAGTMAAGYGGGGNRLNPTGGQGVVVVVY